MVSIYIKNLDYYLWLYIVSIQVAGRILDRRYDVYGKDITTGIKLDSDVYNPVYEEKTEFREPNIPPTATLLLKVMCYPSTSALFGIKISQDFHMPRSALLNCHCIMYFWWSMFGIKVLAKYLYGY